MPKQHANATWTGNLKEGSGEFQLPKGNHTGNYTFATRFEDGNGTNPEELVGAAIASCFSMFLSATLEKKGFPSNSVSTQAEVSLEVLDNGPSITSINLTVEADVPAISESDFNTYVNDSKVGCPISKLYTGTSIGVNAKLTTSA